MKRYVFAALVALFVAGALHARSTDIRIKKAQGTATGPFAVGDCEWKSLLEDEPELKKNRKAVEQCAEQFMVGIEKGLGRKGVDDGGTPVKARLERFQGGNRAARVWVGYGAGQTELEFTVKGKGFSFVVVAKMSSAWTVQRLALVAGQKAGKQLALMAKGGGASDDDEDQPRRKSRRHRGSDED